MENLEKTKELNLFTETSELAYKTEIKSILKEIEKTEKKRNKLNIQLSQLHSDLRVLCKHEDFRIESDYIEGTYYDRSYTKYCKVCKVCGEVLEKWESERGGYG